MIPTQTLLNYTTFTQIMRYNGCWCRVVNYPDSYMTTLWMYRSRIPLQGNIDSHIYDEHVDTTSEE